METSQNKIYKKTVFILLLSFLLLLFSKKEVSASLKLKDTSCPGRYVTFVNPVRGRSLWSNKSLTPLINQYQALQSRNFPATWLLQYDALVDRELVDETKKFLFRHEKGIFLEVSRSLAEAAKVPYDETVRWSSPKIVFLSAYSPKERRRLIDELMRVFKNTFGYFPKSVGAWWVDSYSINYLNEKYGVKTAMVVADQKVTDSYGVWGQWWGYPYIASRENIQTPTNDVSASSVLVIQWAQRDFIDAYGGVGEYSLYSLQANDYPRVGKDISYFVDLASDYLNCKNQIGQITVGLETGQESIEAWPEYLRQLDVLKNTNELNFVTMENFYNIYIKNPPITLNLGNKDKSWVLTPNYRENRFLNENIIYRKGISYSDFFIADRSEFLMRYQSDLSNMVLTNWFYWWIFVLPVIYFYLWKKKEGTHLLPYLLFLLSTYGLLLFSYQKYGWQVYLGPKVNDLVASQLIVTLFCFLIYYIFGKILIKNKKQRGLFYWFAPLVYGIDYLVEIVRYSYISGVHYLGVIISLNRFLGVGFNSMNKSVSFFNFTMPVNQADSFLKVPLNKIFENMSLWFLFYPLLHLILSLILSTFVLKTKNKIQYAITTILLLLFLGYLYSMLQTQPKIVVPIEVIQ